MELKMQPKRVLSRYAISAVGVGLLALVVVAGLFGPEISYRNPANYLAWLYFWPGVALLVAIAGDVWQFFNPWRTLRAWLGGESATGKRVTWWPAVALFACFVWFDLASGLADRPRDIAIAVLILTAAVLIPTWAAGSRWFASAEPFGKVMAAIGAGSLLRLVVSSPPPDLKHGWDRLVLYALVVSSAVFDPIIATPQWSALAGLSGVERGGLAFMALRTAGLAATFAGTLVLAIAGTASFSATQRLPAVAARSLLAALPIGVALMVAHNLPTLIHLGPLLPVVVAAWLRGGEIVAGGVPAVTGSSPIWFAELALILIGLAWSVVLTMREDERVGDTTIDRIAGSYSALAMLLILAGSAVLILYQPIAAISR